MGPAPFGRPVPPYRCLLPTVPSAPVSMWRSAQGSGRTSEQLGSAAPFVIHTELARKQWQTGPVISTDAQSKGHLYVFLRYPFLCFLLLWLKRGSSVSCFIVVIYTHVAKRAACVLNRAACALEAPHSTALWEPCCAATEEASISECMVEHLGHHRSYVFPHPTLSVRVRPQ